MFNKHMRAFALDKVGVFLQLNGMSTSIEVLFCFFICLQSIVQDSIFVIRSHLILTFCSVQIKNSKYKKIFKTNYHLFVILKGVSYNLKRPMVVLTMVTRRASCIIYKHSFIQPFWKLELTLVTKQYNIRN
jgi:hypothetical protein